ncbi:MAG: hypothetical protein KatS3mg105_3852 [Gemmatales bacterium]|nr:MAG: hypothetical protein KatS3mg105_3852 [Gemmatales bacterium]
MSSEFLVQKAGLQGDNWKTVCRGSEEKAREVLRRQLKYHSIGRFRLLDPEGKVIEEHKARPIFSRN